MNLKKWQKLNKVNNRQLSEMVRAQGVPCHETMLSHYHQKRKNFSPSVAVVIEDVTCHAVTLREILLRNIKGRGEKSAI
jgi:thermostable 8-oxoguanine DNA glycosylase